MSDLADDKPLFDLRDALFGVYSARVIDIEDPNQIGRVKVYVAWGKYKGDKAIETWARVATLMAGDNRGTWFMPEVGDEVLVSFEGGNPARPYVIGALWNRADGPPQILDGTNENNVKSIVSRQGSRIEFDDTPGEESLTLETRQNKIVLREGGSTIEISDGNGNFVEFGPAGITINASAKITLNCSILDINSSLVSVNSGLARFSGMVQSDTVLTNTVVSASYTPGAGNIW